MLNDKRTNYLKNLDDNYHCKDGMVDKKDFDKNIVKTNKGKEFNLIDANFIDQFSNLKRGAQIMDKKDLGLILSNTMVGGKSIVFDCGSGTGASALFFARYCKKVYSFDIRDDHIEIVKENMKRLELNNLVLKKKNIYEEELDVKKNCDLFVLDVPEPERAIRNVSKKLKVGGFFVSYSPCVTQVMKLNESLGENFLKIKVVEVIEREWHVEGRKVRPLTKDFSHTGFLAIFRKIGEE